MRLYPTECYLRTIQFRIDILYDVCRNIFSRSDQVPTMLVESWPLSTDMWDGDNIAGPIPTIFTEDPETTSTNQTKDPAKLHWDLSKLYKVQD